MLPGEITGEYFQSPEYWVQKYGTFSNLGALFSVTWGAVFPPKRTAQGRQSIQLGKSAFSDIVYPVTIGLQRKEWILCNDVSWIM